MAMYGYVKLLEGTAVNMVKCMAFKTPMVQWVGSCVDITRSFMVDQHGGKGVLAVKPQVYIWVVNRTCNCGTLW